MGYMDGAIQAGERAAFEVAQELYTASDIRQRMQKPQAPLDPEPESTEVCILVVANLFVYVSYTQPVDNVIVPDSSRSAGGCSHRENDAIFDHALDAVRAASGGGGGGAVETLLRLLMCSQRC